MSFFFSLGGFVVIAAIYIYSSHCLARMGKKLGELKTWKAWVPLVNIFFTIKLAGKSYWWFLLLLIPVVNIVVIIIIWAKIVTRLGRSKWHVLLLFLPVIGLIDLGYLALSNSTDGSNYEHKQIHTTDHNVNQELVNYIKQSVADGHDLAAIKQSLLSAGWPEQEIEDVFRASQTSS